MRGRGARPSRAVALAGGMPSGTRPALPLEPPLRCLQRGGRRQRRQKACSRLRPDRERVVQNARPSTRAPTCTLVPRRRLRERRGGRARGRAGGGATSGRGAHRHPRHRPRPRCHWRACCRGSSTIGPRPAFPRRRHPRWRRRWGGGVVGGCGSGARPPWRVLQGGPQWPTLRLVTKPHCTQRCRAAPSPLLP